MAATRPRTFGGVTNIFIATMAEAYKSFDDGTIVQPASSAHGDWHVPPAVEKPADAAVAEPQAKGVLGKLKKKGKKGAQADGDGKAGIPGAVFNLANTVRCAHSICAQLGTN